MLLNDLPPSILRFFALWFGLLWGSFLNVVIYRVPRGMSVVQPPSHCPACGAPIRPWHNVPVFGWLFLRGRARCCGAKVSARYPLVEAIGGILSLAILEVLLATLPELTPLHRALAIYVADFALALGLVATAFIDLDFMYVPTAFTIVGAILGVATASFRGMTFVEALLGAGVGFGVVWIPFIKLYALLRGRPGMGLGDAWLLMLAGAWFGWPGALLVLGAGAVQATLIVLPILLVKGRIEEPPDVIREREEARREIEQLTGEERARAEAELAEDPLADEPAPGLGMARLAFGPFLALASIECLLFGPQVITWLKQGY